MNTSIQKTLALGIIILALPFAVHAEGPSFSGVAGVTAEATSSNGASVPYTLPTATDAAATPVPVSCTPASGDLFALGTTTVSCAASDSLFATTTASFTITVLDTQAPAITAPSHTVLATSTFVYFPILAAATARDTVDAHPILSAVPTSLAAGTSSVIWTAVDASGNSATTSVSYTVLSVPDVTAPDTCTVTDTDGIAHSFATTSSEYLGICALSAAKSTGIISDFTLKNNPSLGLYIESINGTTPGATEYWSLWHNDEYASCGITCEVVHLGDTLSFVLTDWMSNTEIASSSVAFRIASLGVTSPVQTSSGGSSGAPAPVSFDMGKALAYLLARQNTDGSFASPLVTDWSAIALAAANPAAATTLKAYLSGALVAPSSVTEYERRAMALQALGLNPYTTSGRDHIAPIVAAFDGTQVGDPTLDNDDIFALFPLLHAGYQTSDTMIQTIVSSVLRAQRPDGSWDASVDMTAAAMQAIGPFYMMPGYGKAMGMGAQYLATQQQNDGGWSTADATSWVITMMNSVAESDPAHALSFTAPSGKKASDGLAAAQHNDGGAISSGDRTWSTAYALMAGSGKSWVSVLQRFPKSTALGGSSGGAATSTSLTPTGATTTESVATSTAATTTPLLFAATTSMTSLPIAEVKQVHKPTTAQKTKRLAPVVVKNHALGESPTSTAPGTLRAQSASAAEAVPRGFWSLVKLWLSRWF